MAGLVEILQHIEKKPGMYFCRGGESPSIRSIEAFIVGYQCAAPKSAKEMAFFPEWVAAHYGVLQQGQGLFSLILEHVGGDEREGWNEFFRLLPQFLRDKKDLGDEAIIKRFDAVQNKLLNKQQS